MFAASDFSTRRKTDLTGTTDVRVTILGTSSAIPTFKRSLSGTLLDYEADTFLFDCGEGTQFQFMRAGARRGRLRAIFITHLHGDHYYGLPGLLSSLNLNRRTAPLDIYGPTGIARFVDFVTNFPRRQNAGYAIRCHELARGFVGVVCETKDYVVRTRPLSHRVPTQGYRFEERPRRGTFDVERAEELGVPFGPERRQLQDGETVTLADGTVVRPQEVVGPPKVGRSFAYCTDTELCIDAKRLADNCDLLVHEATYGDELANLAFERQHATIRQAATVAAAAGAKRFVATHFSTRYDRESIGTLEREGRAVYPDLLMARDLMTVEITPSSDEIEEETVSA